MLTYHNRAENYMILIKKKNSNKLRKKKDITKYVGIIRWTEEGEQNLKYVLSLVKINYIDKLISTLVFNGNICQMFN